MFSVCHEIDTMSTCNFVASCLRLFLLLGKVIQLNKHSTNDWALKETEKFDF